MSAVPEDSPPQPSPPGCCPFRPVHFLYAAVLLAWSIVTFGPWGLLFSVPVLGVWACVFASHSRPLFLLLMLCVLFLLGLLLLPAVQQARDASRVSQCRNNLKQIGLALHNYHEVHATFPPAYIADKDGRRHHSWRTLLLPYLDERSLYEQYDFNQPWDGPPNTKLLSRIPELYVYRCPEGRTNASGRGPSTSYVAVVGARTAWPGAVGARFQDFKDGTSNTILLIEDDSHGICWAEPRDVTFEEALRRLSSRKPESPGKHRTWSFFYDDRGGSNVLVADGSVRFLQQGIDRDTLSALLTIDDGKGWPEPEVARRSRSERKLKVGNCIRFAVFVLLVVFPLPWVWLNPHPRGKGKRANGRQARKHAGRSPPSRLDW